MTPPKSTQHASSVRRLLQHAGRALLLLAASCGAFPDEGALLEDGGDDPAVEPRPVAAPPGYYAGASGRSGRELLSALAGIIGNQRALSYSAARNTMFGTIDDPDSDNVVPCVYTGRRGAGVSSSATASSVSMNTEHTWPQSLGATGVAQADLHHLFPTDMDTNGRRGNYPFGEVAAVTWTARDYDGGDASQLGRDASGRTVFEPQDRLKGDIARAVFYFYTRYAQRPPSRFSLSNFNTEEATLRRWHRQDPPDAAERARNDAVYGAQGNRNPYVDHPEYVTAIPDFP